MKPSFARASALFVSFAAIPAFGQFIETATEPPPSAKELDLPTIVETISGLPVVDPAGAGGDGAGGFIKDEAAAILLGKAFYWDMQVGSDGVACGTCHYHAGADARERNQLSPGLKGGSTVFDPAATGAGGPNYVLTPGDFPFHQLADPADRDSAVLFDTDDVVSSQGTFSATFNDVIPGAPGKDGRADDDCTIVSPDPLGFHLDSINTRRVEPRNTPTVINAAFNHRNFWDGRANNIFNGVDPFGQRNAAARVLEKQGGNVVPIQVAFENGSLASQSVGPPSSDLEMSCGEDPVTLARRNFMKIGKKMVSAEALAGQRVHPQDSVLGSVSAHPKDGLDGPGNSGIPYSALIEAAISKRFWDSDKLFDVDKNETGSGTPTSTDEYTLMEANFSLIWGLAIEVYLRTLVSDDAPYDQWAEAPGGRAPVVENTKGILTEAQMRGMNLFFTNEVGERGNCSTCHQGPLFTTATFPFTEEAESGEFPEREQLVERMRGGDGVNIAENLLRFFITGEGTVGGATITGPEGPGGPPARAGSWELPGWYPATVGGDIHVTAGGCTYTKVTSFMMNMDTVDEPNLEGPPFNTVDPVPPPGPPPFPNTETRDAVFAMTGDGCELPIQVTIIDNGPGEVDTATIFEVIVPRLPAFFPGDQEKPAVLGQPLAAGPILAAEPGVVDTFQLRGPTLYDTAFYNIGVRPTAEDPGVGAADPFGSPLSITKQWINQLLGTPAADVAAIKSLNFARVTEPFNWFGDAVFFPGGFSGPSWLTHEQQENPFLNLVPFCQEPGFGGQPIPGIDNEEDCLEDDPANTWVTFVNKWANLQPVFAPTMYTFPFPPGRGDEAVPAYSAFNPEHNDAIENQATAVDGAFKVPNLRNVTLTAPYFHNGGQLTLKQVMEFYNRGGDFAIENLGDLAPNIHPLGLSDADLDDLVAFIEAFTDERVRCELAPFDHPEIRIANGARGYGQSVTEDNKNPGQSKDQLELIQAVGAGGRPANFAPCIDTENFLP